MWKLHLQKAHEPGKPWGQWRHIVHNNGTVTSQPYGDRCEICEIVHKSQEWEEEWDEQKNGVATDEYKRNQWALAMSMAELDAKRPWLGSQVALDRTRGTRVYCKSRGLSPPQFEQIPKFSGKKFQDLGYVQKLLPDNKGQWFVGICVVDDGTLGSDIGTHYESFYTVGASQFDLMMVPSKQVMQNQPTELFDFLRKPQCSGGREHAITKGVRLSAVEPDAIMEKIKLLEDGKDVPEEQGDVADSEHRGWVSCLEFRHLVFG